MAPNIARYGCMIFGFANVIGAIIYGAKDIFMLVAGVLVGSVWFAFGAYGGFPLIDTVLDWHPPIMADAIEDTHRQGLLVMRRRKWIAWLAVPAALAVAALLMPLLMRTNHPEWIVLILGVPFGFINLRYYLSRCPRCGLGFFTRSLSRAALIRRGNSCGHCGLSLNAYKKTYAQPNTSEDIAANRYESSR